MHLGVLHLVGSGGEAQGADAFRADSTFAANGNTIYCTLLIKSAAVHPDTDR